MEKRTTIRTGSPEWLKRIGWSMLGLGGGLIAGAISAETVDLQRPSGQAGDLVVEKKSVEIEDGRTLAVEAGTFLVPENRGRKESGLISVPFYRVRSTADKPAAPIFLLAGGPGSSWIDRFKNAENFDEVLFYRSIADVVLFDQRGAGHSRPELHCDGIRRILPFDKPLDPTIVATELQEMAVECRDRWIAAGVDLDGYTTIENAADVLALQRALGYRQMSLVGGSYGSHLALALMRQAPDALHRVILYGVEGLDQTWDDPLGRLAALERIAGSAENSPELGPAIPDEGLISLLEETAARLEAEPALVTLGEGEESTEVTIDGTLVRRVAGFQAGRRSRPNAWPEFILDLAAHDYSNLARGAYALRHLRLDNPMHYMMDCASGISSGRRERYRQSAAQQILGDINAEYESLCSEWKAPDLGDSFRAPVVSRTPTLVLHGTWDTSTPIENAREVMVGLTNGQLVEVIGGSHGALYNLYAHWPLAHERIGAFLRGEEVRFPSSVTLPAVLYEPRAGR